MVCIIRAPGERVESSVFPHAAAALSFVFSEKMI
jgi:hypothetical protein